MPNQYYIISEVQFFKDKEDKKIWDFVSGTGIDLNKICSSTMPILTEIDGALIELGLKTKKYYDEGKCVELKALNENNIGIWLLFTNLENETTPINMFEIGRGSDAELAIDFVKSLAKTHGNFLYYFDGGAMSLITATKSKQIIMKEIYST